MFQAVDHVLYHELDHPESKSVSEDSSSKTYYAGGIQELFKRHIIATGKT